jgi:hypothetical protein
VDGVQPDVAEYPTVQLYVFVPQVAAEEVLVVATARLLHPVFWSTVNEAVGVALTQTVLVVSSIPQVLLPAFNLIV